MSRRVTRPLLALLTAGLLTLVGAVPAAIAVPVLLDSETGPGFEISLFTDADNPGWVGVEITNTTAAAVTYGLGASGTSPTDIVPIWQTGWTTLDDFAAETVEAGQTFNTDIPGWSGATLVFYSDPLGTPTEFWRTTLPGPFLPFAASGTEDTLNLHAGYDVAISPSAARVGEEPYISAELGTPATANTASVWAVTPENITYDLAGDWGYDPNGAVYLDDIPVTGTLAAGPIDISALIGFGTWGLIVGDPVSGYYPAGPAIFADDINNTSVISFTSSTLTIEAGPVRQTPAGPGTVSPADQLGNHPVEFTFDFVTTPGTTTVTTSTTGPTPTGFSAFGEYYELATTAVFSGQVQVCITYDPVGAPDPLTLYHYTGGIWQAIGTSVTPGVVCGMTSSFSPFVLGTPTPTFYPWSGFLDPVSNTKVNTELAGSIIPIRFRVGGDKGLDVIVPGGAASGVAACTVGATPASTQAATTTLGVKLQYVKASQTYWYFWQTKTAWAGTCRTFVLTLEDGSVHTASFKFVKLTLGSLLRAILKAI